MKLLLLDIETAPNVALVWGLAQDYISPDHLLETGYVICWSAKFLGERVMHSSSIMDGEEEMIRRVHSLLDEADGVITYNGNKFDLPILNREFVSLGFSPPSPYKKIDLYRVVKGSLRFASNKLDFVCRKLGLGAKVQHRGMDLWRACMNRDQAAIEEMVNYNQQDVFLLERLYNKLLPWVAPHVNHSVHTGKLVCPSCGGSHHQQRGYSYTQAGKYPRYQCQGCGTWFRGTKTEAAKEKYVRI